MCLCVLSVVLQCVCVCSSTCRSSVGLCRLSIDVVGFRPRSSAVYSFFLALSLAVTAVVAAEVEVDEGWTLGARVANLTME